MEVLEVLVGKFGCRCLLFVVTESYK